MKKILILLIALVLLLSSCEEKTKEPSDENDLLLGSNGNQIEYIYKDGVIRYYLYPNGLLLGYNATVEYSFVDEEVPEEVTIIGKNAYHNLPELKTVKVGKNVTEIQSSAFCNCPKLIKVELPNTISKISDNTFSKCTSLEDINIPSSVTVIGNGAFNECTSLTSIEIPSSVTAIGNGAFNECTSLASIEIPSGVKSIEDSTFAKCTSLTSITIPNSVTTIKSKAFERCTALTSITIPGSVTSISSDAFSGCNNLTINFGGTLEEWYKIGFDAGNANIICNNDTKAYFRIQKNGENYTVKGLTPAGKAEQTVEIPNIVTAIGEKAFSAEENLKDVTFEEGSNVSSIGNQTILSISSF